MKYTVTKKPFPICVINPKEHTWVYAASNPRFRKCFQCNRTQKEMERQGWIVNNGLRKKE